MHETLSHAGGVKSRAELHAETYRGFRDKYSVASQLVIEAISYAWSVRKTVKRGIRKCIVRFDKRLFSLRLSFRGTKRGNPVLSLD
ncbi:MAG: hypothetical protein FJZ49_01000 [Candidatus Verstraetearchaeota archaeon]|nr:hypothetical protein [Candidatus Verstraetearchaeota archaeon]